MTSTEEEELKVVDFGPPRGRGLIKSSAIQKGQVIFDEEPFICCQFAWNQLYHYQACEYCIRPLESAVDNARRLTGNPELTLPSSAAFDPLTRPVIHKCSGCSALYCSDSCLSSASVSYHAVICPKFPASPLSLALDELNELWRNMHFPPESSTIFLLVRIIGACMTVAFNPSPSAQNIVDSLSQLICPPCRQSLPGLNAPVIISHRILDGKFSSRLSDLHQAFIRVLLCVITQNTSSTPMSEAEAMSALKNTSAAAFLDIDHFKRVLCLVGLNGQGIATSPFSVWVKHLEGSHSDPDEFQPLLDNIYQAMDEHSGCFLDSEGVGLYKRQSLINHSCDPNAVVEFDGQSNRLSVVATKAIPPGHEITICYLDPCDQKRSVHSRRKLLSSYYLFFCECRKCLDEKMSGAPSETSEDEESDSDGQMQCEDD